MRVGNDRRRSEDGVLWRIPIDGASIALEEDMWKWPTDHIPFTGTLTGTAFSANYHQGDDYLRWVCQFRGGTLVGTFDPDSPPSRWWRYSMGSSRWHDRDADLERPSPLRSSEARFRLFTTILLFACAVSGCGPSPPTAPTRAESSPPSPPVGSGPLTVSGTVYDVSSVGEPRIPGGRVHVWADSASVGYADVQVEGTFALRGVPAARLVRLVWVPSLDVNGFEQLHPASAVVSTDSGLIRRDVAVARRGARTFACNVPTLSGIVYETIPTRRRILTDTRVLYTLAGYGGFDAYTTTDAEGRFRFCGLPAGPATLGAGDCHDAVMTQSIEVKGDTVVDVDLTAFNDSCP
jgi:hypothetical protein